MFADGIKLDSGSMYVSFQNDNLKWTLMKIFLDPSTITTTFYLESSMTNSAAFSNTVLTDSASSYTYIIVMGSL